MQFWHFNYLSAIMMVPYFFSTTDLLFPVNVLFLHYSEMFLCPFWYPYSIFTSESSTNIIKMLHLSILSTRTDIAQNHSTDP